MAYTFFAICAYILMRAFEVLFADQKGKRWYTIATRIIAVFVLYAAIAGMLVFYFEKLKPLGFDSN